MTAEWSRLTVWLLSQGTPRVTIGWDQFDAIVGGLPASAVKHYPQWWHGDRPNTRAWRAAGYELDHVELGRTVTFRRTGPVGPTRPPQAGTIEQDPSVVPHAPGVRSRLPENDPRRAMIILGCSKGKAHGGEPLSAPSRAPWTDELEEARRRVAGDSQMDASLLMPAWQRYTGTFYETCRPTLARAIAAEANIVIVSGGYGVVTATELIGWYDKKLDLGDWPHGTLERALLQRARNTHPETVVAFLSATTDYARLVRRTPWGRLGVPTYLVTARVAGGGMVNILRTLANAFAAYWDHKLDGPPDIDVDRIA